MEESVKDEFQFFALSFEPRDQFAKLQKCAQFALGFQFGQ